MPKVTLLEPQKKTLRLRSGQSPRRFNIYLDGKFAFGADEDTVVKFRLVVGKEIDEGDLDKILLETEVGKLMGKMYGLLQIRLRSEKEIRDYFRRKNQVARVKSQEEISDLLIDKVVENLKQKGLINDLEFAKAWVESRRRSKKKGLMVIKSELFQKGIDREIVDEVTRVESLESSEEDLAKEALEKKARVWKNLKGMEFKKKATEFLMRRGFEYSISKEVVEKFLEKE